MGFYTKQSDKKSGDGLALTEWNDLSNAVAGNSSLKLAISQSDKVGIGTNTPDSKLTVQGDVNIGGTGNAGLKVRHIDGKEHVSDQVDHLYLNHYTNRNVFVGFGSGGENAGLVVSGNVGIGTTNPSAKLEVSGDVKANRFIGDGSQLTNLSVGATGLNLATASGSKVGIGTTNPTVKLEVSGEVKATRFIAGDTLITGRGGRNFFKDAEKSDGHGLRVGAAWGMYGIYAETGKGVVGGVDGVSLQANAVTITRENNVGIGTTDPQSKLHIKQGNLHIHNGNLTISRLDNSNDNNASMWVTDRSLIFRLEKSVHGPNKMIQWDGDTDLNTFSDQRLKTNIVKEEDILSRLMQLEVKNYNWKDSPDRKLKPIGFVAQDVKPLFPSLVGEFEDPETKESTMTLKYANFGVLAVGAIKELKLEHDKRITVLEKAIADLQKKFDAR